MDASEPTTHAPSPEGVTVVGTPTAGSAPTGMPVVRFRKLKILLVVLVILTSIFPLGAYGLVKWRTTLSQAGLGAVDAPSTPALLDAAEGRTGRFTAHLEYVSAFDSNGPGISTDVVWDDDWFFEDPTAYNHELATTCSVLSAIANVESSYYQAGSGALAYMENALAELGFEDISSASYRYRSEILDEIVNLLSNSCDVTAYSIATKHVTNSETGRAKTLLLISIRGTYGTEWVSNVNLARFYGAQGTDHEGFAASAEEIVEQLRVRLDSLADQGMAGEDVALLFCGHSRGGAVSNVAAALVDDAAGTAAELVPTSSVYAYTFACPNTTLKSGARGGLYANVFNMINPGDFVPRLPLAAWGYERYGRDLVLPREGDQDFSDLWSAMCAHYREDRQGIEADVSAGNAANADTFEAALAAGMPTQDDFATAGGIVSFVRVITSSTVTAAQAVANHDTSTYIAWMQAISGEGNLHEGLE